MTIYVKFGISGIEVYEEISPITHFSPVGYLQLIIGNDGFYKAPPGYITGFAFGVNNGMYFGT